MNKYEIRLLGFRLAKQIRFLDRWFFLSPRFYYVGHYAYYELSLFGVCVYRERVAL
jgi:hypothetical protein